MSSDNFVAVKKLGQDEWIVYHACASTGNALGDKKCFYDRDKALKYAHDLVETIAIVEYGVQEI